MISFGHNVQLFEQPSGSSENFTHIGLRFDFDISRGKFHLLLVHRVGINWNPDFRLEFFIEYTST